MREPGHIAAAGIAMVGWIFRRLPGMALAKLQVPAPRVAEIFDLGGRIRASVCTVLRRVKP
jgi:hypothetical protein